MHFWHCLVGGHIGEHVMTNDVLIPIIASLLTLILTKLFDSFMVNRKSKMDSVIQSITAIDEITTAATDTITYLRKERDEAREEKKSSDSAKEAAIAEKNAIKTQLEESNNQIIELNKRIKDLLIEVRDNQKDC